MNYKTFGNLLIAAGCIIAFSILVTSSWYSNQSFMFNIINAVVWESCTGDDYFYGCNKIIIHLGPVLIIPFVISTLGLMISKGYIDEGLSKRIFTFLK